MNDAASKYPITEVPIPERMGGAGWSRFVNAVQLHSYNETATYGTPDASLSPAETWPSYADPTKNIKLIAAHDGQHVIALGTYDVDFTAGHRTAWLHVDVHPQWTHRGLGSAVAAALHDFAASDRVSKAIVYASTANAPGPRIAPTTGVGSLPRDTSGVRFLVGQGYKLEQVRRGSRLALPVDTSSFLASSKATSGDDYAVHHWIDHTPAQWRADMTVLRQQMSTAAPTAGLGEPEDVWTERRLLDTESRTAMSGRRFLTTAIEHLPSGCLAGFTTLAVPDDSSRPISQEDTLVLPEHRGHRLGALLKVTNLDYMHRQQPGHPSVITFNAEDNAHMLQINEAIGFMPFGYEGAWRRDPEGSSL